jgi:hypothetical protein
LVEDSSLLHILESVSESTDHTREGIKLRLLNAWGLWQHWELLLLLLVREFNSIEGWRAWLGAAGWLAGLGQVQNGHLRSSLGWCLDVSVLRSGHWHWDGHNLLRIAALSRSLDSDHGWLWCTLACGLLLSVAVAIGTHWHVRSAAESALDGGSAGVAQKEQ